MGAQLRRCGRTGVSRTGGPENARETGVGRAKRSGREKFGRYAHLGTANYNPSTARYYTDLSLLTSGRCRYFGGERGIQLFDCLREQPSYKRAGCPARHGENMHCLDEREARHARRGRPARLIVKVNALVDPPIIAALYRASQAGVEIDLIVRGQSILFPICAGKQPNSSAQRGRAVHSSTVAFFILKMAANLKFIWGALTGCRVIFMSAWRCCFRSRIPIFGTNMRGDSFRLPGGYPQGADSWQRWYLFAASLLAQGKRFLCPGASDASGGGRRWRSANCSFQKLRRRLYC